MAKQHKRKHAGAAAGHQQAHSKQQHQLFDLQRCIEGLRAVREEAVNLGALRDLQHALRTAHTAASQPTSHSGNASNRAANGPAAHTGPTAAAAEHPHPAAALILTLDATTPFVPLLTAIWDMQLKARNVQIMTALVSLVAHVLNIIRSATSGFVPASNQAANQTQAHTEPTDTDAQGYEDGAGDEGELVGVGGGVDVRVGGVKGSGSAAATAASDAALHSIADALARQIVASRIRALQHCLSGDSRQQANAALCLLGAVAGLGVSQARALIGAMDTLYEPLAALAKPPRDILQQLQEDSAYNVSQRVSRCKPYWRQWRAYNPLTRPSRALVVDLMLCLLSAADMGQLSSKLLSARQLIHTLTGHIASDPPAKVLRWLQVMAERALSPDSSVPPPTRGTLWSDTALAQLADLAATHDTAASGQDGGGGAAADTQQVAARAAAEVLVCVLTDPRQGLIRGRAVLDAPLLAPAGAPAGGGGGAEGVRRALRLLARLRPAVHALHASVLRGAVSGYPALAAEYISSSTNMSLDPMANDMWVAQVTLLTTMTHDVAVSGTSALLQRIETATTALLQASAAATTQQGVGTDAMAAQDPMVQGPRVQACDGAAAAAVAVAAAGAVCQPPDVQSPSARLALRRLVPAALTKAVLSKGLAHKQPLVVAVTLQAIHTCLQAAAPLLRAADAAVAAAAASSQPAAARAWAAFAAHVRASLAARLPDVGQIVALAGAAATAGVSAKAPTTTKATSQHINAAMSDMQLPLSAADDPMSDTADLAKGMTETDSNHHPALGSSHTIMGGGGDGRADGDEDIQQLEDAVFTSPAFQQLMPTEVPDKAVDTRVGAVGDGGGGAKAASRWQQVQGAALTVLTAVVAHLPETAAHVDPFKLLPVTAGGGGASTGGDAAGGAAGGGSGGGGDVATTAVSWQLAWLQCLDTVTHSLAHTRKHAQYLACTAADGAYGAVVSAGAAATPPVQLSSAQLQPLLRLYTAAPAPAVRAIAGRHLLERVAASGLCANTGAATTSTLTNHSDLQIPTEALVWVGALPQPSLAPAGHAAAAPATPAACPAAALFCEVLVTTSRRPHEAYEELCTALSGATHTHHPAEGTATAQPASEAGVGVGLLLGPALRRCLRACRPGAKTPAAHQLQLSSYLAGVVNLLSLTTPSPHTLLAILTHTFTSELSSNTVPGTDSQADVADTHRDKRPKKAKHGPVGAGDPQQGVGVTVCLPGTCQPLHAAYTQLRDRVVAAAAADGAAGAAAAAGSALTVTITVAAEQGTTATAAGAAAASESRKKRRKGDANADEPSHTNKAPLAELLPRVDADAWLAAHRAGTASGGSVCATAAVSMQLALHQQSHTAPHTEPQPDHSLGSAMRSGVGDAALVRAQQLLATFHPATAAVACAAVAQLTGQPQWLWPATLVRTPAAARPAAAEAAAYVFSAPHIAEAALTAAAGVPRLCIGGPAAGQLVRAARSSGAGASAGNSDTTHLPALAVLTRACVTPAVCMHGCPHCNVGASTSTGHDTTPAAACSACGSSKRTLLTAVAPLLHTTSQQLAAAAPTTPAAAVAHAAQLQWLCLASPALIRTDADAFVSHTLAILRGQKHAEDQQRGAARPRDFQAAMQSAQQVAAQSAWGTYQSPAAAAAGSGPIRGSQTDADTLTGVGKQADSGQAQPASTGGKSKKRKASRAQEPESTDIAGDVGDVDGASAGVYTGLVLAAAARLGVAALSAAAGWRGTQLRADASQAANVSELYSLVEWCTLHAKMPTQQSDNIDDLRLELLRLHTAQHLSSHASPTQPTTAAAAVQRQRAATDQLPPMSAALLASCLTQPTLALSECLAELVTSPPDSGYIVSYSPANRQQPHGGANGNSASVGGAGSGSVVCGLRGAVLEGLVCVLKAGLEDKSILSPMGQMGYVAVGAAGGDSGAAAAAVRGAVGAALIARIAAGEDTAAPAAARRRLALLLPVTYAACCGTAASPPPPHAAAVLRLCGEPLLAYAQRKRRKGGSATAATDTTTPPHAPTHTDSDALSVATALHKYAMPVLISAMSDKETSGLLLPDTATWSKVWAKVVPVSGGWACEEWRNLPEAGPAEQALLATHLLQARYPWLKQANSHTTDMPDTEKDDTSMQQGLQHLTQLTRACVSTLTNLYKSTHPHPHPHTAQPEGSTVTDTGASGMGGQTIHAAFAAEQGVGMVVDGVLGDLIAGLGEAARGDAAFGALCGAVAALLDATLAHRAGDAAALRRARRLIAALVPEPANADTDTDADTDMDTSASPTHTPIHSNDTSQHTNSHTTSDDTTSTPSDPHSDSEGAEKGDLALGKGEGGVKGANGAISDSEDGVSSDHGGSLDQDEPMDSDSDSMAESESESPESDSAESESRESESVSSESHESGGGPDPDFAAMDTDAAPDTKGDSQSSGSGGLGKGDSDSSGSSEDEVSGHAAGLKDADGEGDSAGQKGEETQQDSDEAALQQPALSETPLVTNPAAAAAAAQMLAHVVLHDAWQAAVAAPAAAAPLPAACATLPVPPPSIVPYVALLPPYLPSSQAPTDRNTTTPTTTLTPCVYPVSQPPATAASDSHTTEQQHHANAPVKQECLLILDTLLSMRRAYVSEEDAKHGADQGASQGAKQDSSDSDQNSGEWGSGVSEGNGHGSVDVSMGDGTRAGDSGLGRGDKGAISVLAWPETEAEASALVQLQTLLLRGYRGTLSPADRLCARVLFTLDALAAAHAAGRRADVSVMEVRLGGPLARRGFLYGAAALPPPTIAPATPDAHQAQAAQAFLEHADTLLDMRRIALACAAFPTTRTVFADEETNETSDSGESNGFGGALLPGCMRGCLYGVGVGSRLSDGEAGGNIGHGSGDTRVSVGDTGVTLSGYDHECVSHGALDPAWILPMALTALRNPSIPLPTIIKGGLLALCLRALAAPDVCLRAIAYEALGCCIARLEAAEAHATAATADKQQAGAGAGPGTGVGVGGAEGGGGASALRHVDDLRERSAVLTLLRVVRGAVTKPLQRFPAIVALWVAEAATALLAPAAPPPHALAAANRIVRAGEALDCSELPKPVLKALLSGSPTAAAEQVWALRILAAGLQDTPDISLYRSRFIPQLIMTLVQSACLAGSATTTTTTTLLPSHATHTTHATDFGSGSTNTAHAAAAVAATSMQGPAGALIVLAGDSGGGLAGGGGLSGGAGSAGVGGRLADEWTPCLALSVLARCASVPGFIPYLVNHAGLVPWLFNTATTYISQCAATARHTPTTRTDTPHTPQPLSPACAAALVCTEALEHLARQLTRHETTDYTQQQHNTASAKGHHYQGLTPGYWRSKPVSYAFQSGIVRLVSAVSVLCGGRATRDAPTAPAAVTGPGRMALPAAVAAGGLVALSADARALVAAVDRVAQCVLGLEPHTQGSVCTLGLQGSQAAAVLSVHASVGTPAGAVPGSERAGVIGRSQSARGGVVCWCEPLRRALQLLPSLS